MESSNIDKPENLRGFDWPTIGWFTLLLVAVFFPVLQVMVNEWATEESMGHGFFVVPVAAYIIWLDRKSLLSLDTERSWFGLLPVALGFVMLLAGYLGADFFVMRMGFLTSLVGIIATLCGWRMVKALAFPLFLLLFMVRIPLFIYSQMTFPLQLLASSLASDALNMIGIPVYQDGNILELPNQRLSVVEACSGIRSLLSLSFLSLVYGYFFDDRWWMKWVLLVASVPIAIFANAVRVTLTGILTTYNKNLAEGFFHSLEGWMMFMVALGALVGVHLILRRVGDMVGRGKRGGAHA
jgi:exosortase